MFCLFIDEKSMFYFILIFDLNFKDITRNEIYNCAKKFSGKRNGL